MGVAKAYSTRAQHAFPTEITQASGAEWAAAASHIQTRGEERGQTLWCRGQVKAGAFFTGLI